MAIKDSGLPPESVTGRPNVPSSDKEVAIIAVFLQVVNFNANDIFGHAELANNIISTFAGVIKFDDGEQSYLIVQHRPTFFEPSGVIDICSEIGHMYPSYTDKSRVSYFLKPLLVKEHFALTDLVSMLAEFRVASQRLFPTLDHYNGEFKIKIKSS
jgi:hypothetical protein